MRTSILLVLAFACLFQSLTALRVHNKKVKLDAKSSNPIPPFKTFYITQYLDHFNSKDDRTFQERYLLNDDFFNPADGPVFFYAGNEGDIESFYNNTGFVFDIAPIFQALVVFPEHRYYGKSLPFGNQSFDLDKISYLTIEQTLADYAVFLTQLKQDYNLTDDKNPIIAFGGSYGGILAAYMRFKYPNLVRGAIAASAPIYLTAGLAPSTLFFEDVTNDFKKEPGCEDLVRGAFSTMDGLHQKGDYATLSSKFRLCDAINDDKGYHHLLLWLRNAFTIMAMVDYPYPASFLGTLPAWPVHAACQLLTNETNAGTDILTAIADMAGILYNDTTDCFDIFGQFIECADPTSCGLGNDAMAWDYQACTQLNTVQESNGVTDMFPKIEYSEQMREDYCWNTWQVKTRPTWTAVEYWGYQIQAASNIVFSNGLLDPWHRGGPLTNVSESVVAVIVEDGAHHLDLRSSDPQDPPSVRYARYLEIEQIINWVNEARNSKN